MSISVSTSTSIRGTRFFESEPDRLNQGEQWLLLFVNGRTTIIHYGEGLLDCNPSSNWIISEAAFVEFWLCH